MADGEVSPDWEIAPLDTASHDRKPFDCGKPTLNEFLHKRAKQHAKLGLSRTFVAITPGVRDIRGYYSLAPAQVERQHLNDKRLPQEYPVPVWLLARLAVDRNWHRKGLGQLLLFDALHQIWDVAVRVGGYGVVVDPIDLEAAAFYRRFGFAEIESGHAPARMLLGMGKVRQLVVVDEPDD